MSNQVHYNCSSPILWENFMEILLYFFLFFAILFLVLCRVAWKHKDVIMRICVLDEIVSMNDLLCAALVLRHHQLFPYRVPARCVEAVTCAAPVCCKKTFGLMIIGHHPQTGFSWQQVAEEVRATLPTLPILIVSNDGAREVLLLQRQLPHVYTLSEPFHIRDLYAIVDMFTDEQAPTCV